MLCRFAFVGARDGHFPAAVALINYNRFTPIPAIVTSVRHTTSAAPHLLEEAGTHKSAKTHADSVLVTLTFDLLTPR